jgi:hypothetical protein
MTRYDPGVSPLGLEARERAGQFSLQGLTQDAQFKGFLGNLCYHSRGFIPQLEVLAPPSGRVEYVGLDPGVARER